MQLYFFDEDRASVYALTIFERGDDIFVSVTAPDQFVNHVIEGTVNLSELSECLDDFLDFTAHRKAKSAKERLTAFLDEIRRLGIALSYLEKAKAVDSIDGASALYSYLVDSIRNGYKNALCAFSKLK